MFKLKINNENAVYKTIRKYKKKKFKTIMGEIPNNYFHQPVDYLYNNKQQLVQLFKSLQVRN
jgi:hypothetical protein